MKKPVIYADHAATTALSIRALDAMRPFLTDDYANPSTLYHLARSPKKSVAAARGQIAAAIDALPEEIYFTSCGTEADNWALKGIAFQHFDQRKRIITSAIEHHAILRSCAFLQHMGYEVIYLPVDKYGIVSPEILEAAITEDTILMRKELSG